MIGPCPIGVQRLDRTDRHHADLARYVRWEYGPQADVVAFLAEARDRSTKARRNGPSRFAQGVRAIVRALRSLATARGSEAGKTEG